MKIKAHISVVQYPNPDCRIFHVTRQISDIGIWNFGTDEHLNFIDKEPCKLARKLTKAIARVPGISKGSITAYEVSVIKGSAFKWEEIGHFVVGQIVKCLFPECDGDSIEISTTLDYHEGDYTRHHEYAKHHKVPVKFWSHRRPHVYIEHLFNPHGLYKVVDNDKSAERSTEQGRSTSTG